MKFLRILAILILLVFVGAYFLLPTTMKVEKSIVIYTPYHPIYNSVNNLMNWEDWSPWHRLDSNLVSSFSQKTEGEGAVWEFKSESDKVSPGKIVIASVENDQKFVFDHYMDQVGDEKAFSTTFEIEGFKDSSIVTWSMEEELPKWNLFVRLLHPQMLGEHLEEFFNYGLTDLKYNLEEAYGQGINSMDISDMHIETISVEESYFLYKNVSSTLDEFAYYRDLATNFQSILEHVIEFQLEVDTEMFPCFVITDNIDTENNKIDFRVGLYIDENTARETTDIKFGSFPAGEYAKLRLATNITHIEENLNGFKAYCDLNDMVIGDVIENYTMDPIGIRMDPMMRSSQNLEYYAKIIK